MLRCLQKRDNVFAWHRSSQPRPEAVGVPPALKDCGVVYRHGGGHETDTAANLPSATVLVLHLAGRRDAGRWAGHTAGARVNDRNRVTSTLSHRLMELHALLLGSGVVLE